jgi:dimethylhistidine N-methyltransferase
VNVGWPSAGASAQAHAGLSLQHDHGFARAFIEGMRSSPKRIPCKFFYDVVGSALFDQICDLPEYYQTRTERSLLRAHSAEIAGIMGSNIELIEFGAGALAKVRILLDALDNPRAYIPIDISGEYLAKVCSDLNGDYPALSLEPVVADFTRPFVLPVPKHGEARRVGFFPGSTIGNFSPDDAVAFLKTVSGIVRGGGILIGVDLVKDPKILHAAYNDARGVTSAFNKNLLARANRELGANFDLDAFAHRAFFNRSASRIEMHLVSLGDQEVQVGGEAIGFLRQESVHTEDSYKYTVESFRALAWKAGLVPRQFWLDEARLFSVHWLEAD